MTIYEPVMEKLGEAETLLRTAHLQISGIQNSEYDLVCYGKCSVVGSYIENVIGELEEIRTKIYEELIKTENKPC